MSDRLAGLVVDLLAETDALASILGDLPDDAWTTPTPAVGWSVHDQVSHLAFFDDACMAAIVEPERFREQRDALVAGGADFPDRVALRNRDLPVSALREWWQRSRGLLLDRLAGADSTSRIPWYGPDMSLTSAATARLMETWAHGRDVADAVGAEQPATDRLRHVAHLGVRTRGFSYALRGLAPPDGEVRVELVSPSGATWGWGPHDAPDRVTGTAEDFCLLVTQRRHRDDTDLVAAGRLAGEWLGLAQAFAGEPGPGRPARAGTPT